MNGVVEEWKMKMRPLVLGKNCVLRYARYEKHVSRACAAQDMELDRLGTCVITMVLRLCVDLSSSTHAKKKNVQRKVK